MKASEIYKSQIGLVALSISFGILSVFFTYKSIKPFLIIGLFLVLIQFASWWKITKGLKGLKTKLNIIMPLALILFGAIGVSAATTLTREKIELFKDPNHVASCSISPIVACSPIIGSEQASAITGLPNPLFGIFGFGALIVAGMSLLAGGKFANWWWKALWLGIFAGYVFCGWLLYQSLYDIGALCLYCNVVWASVILLFWLTTLYLIVNQDVKLPAKISSFYLKYWPSIIAFNYAVVILLIYLRFDYYWNSLF